MNKLNIFRAVVVYIIFGLVWQLSPEFIKGGLLGFTLLLISLKIEQL